MMITDLLTFHKAFLHLQDFRTKLNNFYLELEVRFCECGLFFVESTDFDVLFLAMNVFNITSSLHQHSREDAFLSGRQSDNNVLDIGLLLFLQSYFHILYQLSTALLEFGHSAAKQHRTTLIIGVVDFALLGMDLDILGLLQLRAIPWSFFIIGSFFFRKEWCWSVL